jgi:hypothetical protein
MGAIHDGLRLACGDNALAHDSKTQMRIRAYKAAYQNPGSGRYSGSSPHRVSAPYARISDIRFMPTKCNALRYDTL